MAKVNKKYNATVQELSIDCGGLNFLTLCGKHINGAYVAFPGFGLSAELAEKDTYYNKNQILAALKQSSDSWLPKSESALESLSSELAEIITPFISEE